MTTKQFLKISACSLFLASGICSTSLNAATSTDIKNLLTTDSVISKLGLFDTPNDAKFSRADAVVLMDRLLTVNDANFNQDMNDYLNPFGDVNPNADYFNSLMRLAYYRVGDTTIISKENEIFRPLDFVSRQEFLKMAMLAFNVPLNVSSNLKNFKDSDLIIGKWSERYFSSAVSNGIIVGDNGSLKPTASITTTEALLILNRIAAKFSISKANSEFLPPESVDVEKMLSSFIGSDAEPTYYDMTAEPIVISDIKVEKAASKCASPNAVVLSAVATADTKTGKAAPYFWWSVSDGYLGKYADETAGASFQKVCFYPATTTIKNYQVTVNGSDNLGFVDKKTLSFASKTLFSNVTPKNIAAKIDLTIPAITEITAGREFILDLSDVKVMEQSVNVGLENLEVILTIDNQTISLFKGVPYNNQLPISVPTLEPWLYGKTGSLQINAYTQSATATKQFKNVVYLPQFVVKGLVVNNSDTALQAQSIKIDSRTVSLDKSNHFSMDFQGDFNNKTLDVEVIGGDEKTNYFEKTTVTLSYDSPVAYILLIGDSEVSSDTDNDGMPDDWEIKYGLNPEDSTDAALDLDGDEISNLDEFNAGSDPSFSPIFKATAKAGDAQVTLTWGNLAKVSNQIVCYTTTKLKNALDCLNDKNASLLNVTSPAVVNNLTNGKKYYFVVSAEHNNGNFSNSPLLSATPKAVKQEGFPTDGYTKIANDGSKLPDSANLGANPKDWACTRDNKTGLIWEVKTTDGGLRDMNNRYSWYEPDASKNDGLEGYRNLYPNDCKGSECDTYAFTNAVNTQGLCGAKDWRMPTVQELSGLFVCFDGKYTAYGYGKNANGAIFCTNYDNVNRPTINTMYFPDIKANYDWFWSSSPRANGNDHAWGVNFWYGNSEYSMRSNSTHVRLVRGGQ